ncbi:hypothetical protein K438DRAFT_1946295 [Mycena galopus ATCC 62051]|nr:hypothetical protein K438DRAFT_1946295 [Mycena galopus ATCC 62051]
MAARRGVVNEAPAILDLCDVVHFIHHIIGDINELPEYQSMMSILKPLIRHFSKSGKSKAYLRDSGEGMGEDGSNIPVRMLAKIGKTRFATHFMSVTTVSPVVHNIQGLVIEKKIKFKSALLQEVFGNRTSVKLPTFLKDILSYEIIVAPLARSLWSLEATTANPSDAFVFWLAITHTLDSIFEKKEKDTGISPKLAGHVRAIFNTRYLEFFNHNDGYFVAFCLDPRYPNAEFLRTRPDRPIGVSEHVSYPHAFFRVKEFLKNVLKALLQQHASHTSDCRCHPILKTQSELDIANALRLQLEAFWLGEPPFHAPMLGVRIFGILVNSMPDERTNSNITWFNSPLRSNQTQEGLLDMIMVGQWYRYHAVGAEGPRRPTVAFRRLDQAVIDKAKMKRREEDSDASDSDTDSTETDEEDDDKELEEISDALRAKLARKRRRKRNNKRTFRSDEVFVIGVDVMLRAPGLKGLLSVADDEAETKESGSAQVQSVAMSQAVDWSWNARRAMSNVTSQIGNCQLSSGNCIPQDSEARIDMLRERAGIKGPSTAASKSKRRKEDGDLAELAAAAAAAGGSMQPAVLPTTDGHINFFEDLEHNAIATAIRTAKKTEPVETERGVPSRRPRRTSGRGTPRKRDTARKSVHDPLTSITHQLAARHASTSTSSSSAYKPNPSYRWPPNANAPPEVQARLTRESSERERAMELIRRKQREMRGSETPSSVHGGGYGDLFNRREVEEAHRGRERRDPRRARW